MIRGSGLVSRLVSYIPEQLHGIVAISVGYIEPGVVWDIGELHPCHCCRDVTNTTTRRDQPAHNAGSRLSYSWLLAVAQY